LVIAVCSSRTPCLLVSMAFFDYEVDYHHQRSSLGAEVKWYGLDLDANKYWGLSSAHTRGVSGESVTEEPLDGHDIRLAAQVP